jgi:transposase
MARNYRPYNQNQEYLLPPSLLDWLPESHLAHFISDVVDSLDLSKIFRVYETGDGRGQPPYHPGMMTKLLLYGYCTGKPSSRKIEQATYDQVPFRFLAAEQHPDHDTIANFRSRHLDDLADIFYQVLRIGGEAGLVKLGHVAVDGSKIKANASKHKAMSYDRMKKAEEKLKSEINELLEKAKQADEADDESFGKGQKGENIPEELTRRESRLKKIEEAKATLEEEARERARQKKLEYEAKMEERKAREEAGEKLKGPPLKEPPEPESVEPEAKAQKNFTDPESRIMLDGATKSFQQSYNAQIAVDDKCQFIVGASLTQDANDKKQLLPMIEQLEENWGQLPKKVSADNGYFSEDNITAEAISGTNLYVPPGREKTKKNQPQSPPPKDATPTEKMRYKLQTDEGRDVYRMRKAIVEPVFGQVKEVMGHRRLLLRGLSKGSSEWKLICTAHNLLKLFRFGR